MAKPGSVLDGYGTPATAVTGGTSEKLLVADEPPPLVSGPGRVCPVQRTARRRRAQPMLPARAAASCQARGEHEASSQQADGRESATAG